MKQRWSTLKTEHVIVGQSPDAAEAAVAADQTQTEHHPERGCGLWAPAALSQQTDGVVWRLYLFICSLDTLDINLTSHHFHKFSVTVTVCGKGF